ncbi:MAG: glycosyltransferase family 4 protein [Gillisia sp.]
MNILHVSGSTSWGGNEQQLLYLIEGLGKYKVAQSLFCFKTSPLLEKVEHLEIEILSIPKCSPFSKKFRKSLSEFVSAKHIDIIHLHTSDSLTGYVVTDMFYGLPVKTIFSKKAVSSKTSFLSAFKYNYHHIDSIVCVSEYVKKHFKKVLNTKNHHKLAVIHDGVDENFKETPVILNLKEKLHLNNSDFIIGNIANHTKAKDLPVMVETLNHLVNTLKLSDVHLVQIGNFSKRTQALKDKIKEYGLESHITFMGFVENAFMLFPQFDIFLMTSEREGGPTVVLESFKNKIPVVTTKVGVIEDCVKNGEHAFVAEVGDFKSLGESIFTLKRDSLIREQLAAKAYKLFVENFTVNHLVEATYTHFIEIMKSRKS